MFFEALSLYKASPASSFEQEVGSAKIKIAYSRPLVRGRKIFGELVPFDKLWRTGASDCTVITTSEDISFGNSILKAGSYSIFSIPSKSTSSASFSFCSTLMLSPFFNMSSISLIIS